MSPLGRTVSQSLSSTFARSRDGDVWIVGGAQLQTALFELDALDRLELFIIPVLLGSGVGLFPAMTKSKTLSLVACEAFDMGVVRVDYRLR